jgi:omega-hydroxy-beta-dihydromenaquinone-9 sulfotransferase
MMAQILGRHPGAHAFNELHFFEQIWNTSDKGQPIDRESAIELYARLISIQRDGLLAKHELDRYMPEATRVIVAASTQLITKESTFGLFLSQEALNHGKSVPVEQTPRNVFYVDEILQVFPDAKFVNMVRDPRAVLLSQKNKWRLRYLGLEQTPLTETIRAWFNYHPIVMSQLWCSGVAASDKAKGRNSVLTVRFEDLVASPQATIRDVCNWLHLGYDADMLNIEYWGSSREKTQANRRGIQASAASGWEKGGLTQEEIFISQKFTSRVAGAYGYTVVEAPFSVVKLLLLFALLPFKLFVAFLFNLHRMKNIKETLVKRLMG